MDILAEVQTKLQAAPAQILWDGKIHRFGPKPSDDKCWYVAREWTFKGQVYREMTYGSWATGEKHIHQSWDRETAKDRSFKTAYKKNTEDSKAILDLEIQTMQKQCRDKWGPIFDAAIPNQGHPYLEFKGITRPFCARVDHHGVLVIPIYKQKGFVGVQRILKNDVSNRFEKRFSKGVEIKGGFCPLSPFKASPYIYIAEGFATAASIQIAFPDVPAICVFSAGNIAPAIEQIRHINPGCKIIIAADKDPNGVGEKHAKQAARANTSTIYRIPKFGVDNPAWTDFNDLHTFEKIEKVKAQLAIDPADFAGIIALGFKEDVYYYTSTENPQIVPMSAGAHTKSHLLDLAALPYWYKHYGMKDDEGNYVGVQWTQAESELKDKCRQAGFFDPQKMRGRGVWLDASRIVVNDGLKLVVDGKEAQHFVSNYHYIRSSTVAYKLTTPFSDDEMAGLLSVFGSLRFKGKHDYVYIAAWAIQSQLFGVMPWRFHLWMVGDRGSGKSTVLSWLGELATRASMNVNSSAAGIRQDIQNDTTPVIYDEAEPDNTHLRDILDIARQSSSNTGLETRRGTATGKSITYNTQALFCFGSIQKTIDKSADASRFFIVELSNKKGQDPDEFKEMAARINYFSENRTRIFSRAVLSAKSVLLSYQVAQVALRGMDLDARMTDQLAAMLACFWVYFSTEPITGDQVTYFIRELELGKSEYTAQNERTDTDDCYAALMSMPLDNMNNGVGHAIHMIHFTISAVGAEEWEKALGFHGMSYNKKEKELFIASESPHIKKKLPAFRDYASVFRRDQSRFRRPEQKLITSYGHRCRGVVISVEI